MILIRMESSFFLLSLKVNLRNVSIVFNEKAPRLVNPLFSIIDVHSPRHSHLEILNPSVHYPELSIH